MKPEHATTVFHFISFIAKAGLVGLGGGETVSFVHPEHHFS
jgi:hypothetical protein